MPDTNTASASVDPDPLIDELVADTPGAALSRAAFTAILDGRTPLLSDLSRATAASSEDVDALIGRGLMLDDTGHVVGAHGLSLVPARQHLLTMRNRQFWTWCAIDGVGIPAGLGADAVAETTCQLCGTPVRLDFHAGDIVYSSHPAVRVWNAQRLPGRGPAGPPHCALMNLFCSAEHLDNWRAAHPDEAGHVHSLAEVAEIGHAEWGALMGGRHCGPDECCP
jgi:alkylmercury lyase